MILDRLLDAFRGQAVTIPPMDGALRPNAGLEDARVLLEAELPDNLCFDGSRILFSSGRRVLALPDAGAAVPRLVAEHDAAVSALAASPAGAVAAALEDGRLLVDGRELPRPSELASATALAFADAHTLLACQGSARHRAGDWVLDLMEKGASGSLWRIGVDGGGAAKLAGDLAFPYGVMASPDGNGILLAESWRHRLLRLPSGGGRAEVVLAKLPGYPARLAPAAGGGAWLALFAPRNRLIEFVLAEADYRAEMMREVPREHWIAPALSSGRSFLEPLQCGAVRTMGIHKPWSPTRSYGLVVRLDAALRPESSLHSRANGKRHGVTSVIEAGGRVLAAAKGGGVVLEIDQERGP